MLEQTGGRYALLNPGRRMAEQAVAAGAARRRSRRRFASGTACGRWSSGARRAAAGRGGGRRAGGAAILSPQTTIADVVALARRAAVMVSGDTGPTHIAAAVGTPIVGIYGPTRPERNGPWLADDEMVSRAARLRVPSPAPVQAGRGCACSTSRWRKCWRRSSAGSPRWSGRVSDVDPSAAGQAGRWPGRTPSPQRWREGGCRSVLCRRCSCCGWRSRPAPPCSAAASVALAGEALRIWAAGHLNKSREVTSSGPYRWFAHPLYVGSSVMGVGLAIASGQRARRADHCALSRRRRSRRRSGARKRFSAARSATATIATGAAPRRAAGCRPASAPVQRRAGDRQPRVPRGRRDWRSPCCCWC